MLPRNSDGDGVKVTVGDLIEYLSSLDKGMEVSLDKDGWMEEDIKAESVQQLIKDRGLFQVLQFGKYPAYLCINN